MAPTDRNEVLPSEGDVAYFVKLHLDKVRFVKHIDEPKKTGLYEVGHIALGGKHLAEVSR